MTRDKNAKSFRFLNYYLNLKRPVIFRSLTKMVTSPEKIGFYTLLGSHLLRFHYNMLFLKSLLGKTLARKGLLHRGGGGSNYFNKNEVN